MGRTLHPLRHNFQVLLALAVVAVAARPVAYPQTGEHVAEAAMEEAEVAMGEVEERHEGPQLAAMVEVALPGTQMKTSPTRHRCLALWPVLSMHLYAALWRQYLCRSPLHIQ